MYFEAIGGSRSYGLEIETSDTDLLCLDNTPIVEDGYNVIRISPEEFRARLMGERDNAYYVQWLFPHEVKSDNQLSSWLLEHREQVVKAQLPYIYRVFTGHVARLMHHADWIYGVYPKRLAYCTLFNSIIANYADGMTFAEAHKPVGELHDYLVSVRRGEIELADALARCELERTRAELAAGFYADAVGADVLRDLSVMIGEI